MLEPLNLDDPQVKKLLEMNFPIEDLNFFRKRGFSFAQLGLLLPLVWAAEPSANEKIEYTFPGQNQQPIFNRGRFTLDKLKELSGLYEPGQLVDLQSEGYGASEMIRLSGRLSYDQILNLKMHLHRDNQQILAMARLGLSANDLIELTLWGLPEFQRLGIRRLGLTTEDLADVKKRGLKEQDLTELVEDKKYVSISFLKQKEIKGLLKRGVNKDTLGNFDFEFLWADGESVRAFPDIRAPSSPLDFVDMTRKPFYLCKGFWGGYYVRPHRKSENIQHYSQNGTAEHIQTFKELRRFLGRL